MSADTQDTNGALDNNKEDVLQPIPASIKYGAMGLLALFLIIIAGFIFSSGDDINSEQTLLDIENPVQNQGSVESQQLESDSSLSTSVLINPVGNSKQIAIHTDEPYLPFIKQIKETEQKLTKLEDQLHQLIADNIIRQQGQDQLIQELQSQLTAQSAKIEQLQANAKSHQLAVKIKIKKKNVKSYRKVKPPFTLVSVDQWGNDLYAVVRFKGKLYEFTSEQGMKGWYVHSFDRSRRTVVFKNKAGTRKELVVKS